MGDLELLSMVDELLLNIIEQIDDHAALCSLSATCSRFRGLVEPFIWRNLLILNGDQASEIALSLQSCPERLANIQELAIHYKHDDASGIGRLNPFIYDMSRLRHLTIESPCPNNGEWRHEAVFTAETKIDYSTLFEKSVARELSSPPLQMLQSLTLHGHGRFNSKFKLGSVAYIFFHPTILDITISCTNFEIDDGIVDAKKIPIQSMKSTALRSLKFIECNVYLDMLEVALSLPKALKELHVGERVFAWDDCVPKSDKPMTGHARFVDILQLQANSLECLEHTGGRYINPARPTSDPANSRKLSQFKNLKHLKVDSRSALLKYVTEDGCPDSLHTLKITDDVEAVCLVAVFQPLYLHFSDFLKRMCTVAAKLPSTVNIDICFSHHSRGPSLAGNMYSFWTSRQGRKLVYDIASTLQSHNARLRIFAETFLKGISYIEPYMYSEERPTEELLYDSQNYWSFSRTDYQSVDDKNLNGGESPVDEEDEEGVGSFFVGNWADMDFGEMLLNGLVNGEVHL
ncbi:hypothetical protein BU24DRAFT_454341 [Aaosphaeria arxii CBS 175.79]|uniref:F-box domain-containing protein n=1 Tax=Aaosphaeria arxii CBS 175.79 TaxID=1450172 RepID=A0A6A5XD14_9PLEO|nr:uncharacterized protein BU24DRAFT_454341 [Aaosphaeria arxii CBS 175.79]KAF2010763.1 hypothetical protein BU24DRAFT_454341 [Aaosphaeria arxii CBS 175.79]